MPDKPPLKITLIDDDTMMRSLVEDFISEKYSHATITSYISGEAALASILVEQDLIILDYHLDSVKGESLNGIEIFKKLKDLFPAVPVIFISGQEESKIDASTLQHGANDYIVKNEKIFQRLETSMAKILGRPSSQKQTFGKIKKNFLLLWLLITVALVGLIIWKMLA